MQVTIHATRDRLPRRFRERAGGRVRRTLSRWRHRVCAAQLFVAEEAAVPFHHCRLVLIGYRGEEIIATGSGADRDRALAEALRRARLRLRRMLQRRIARARLRTPTPLREAA